MSAINTSIGCSRIRGRYGVTLVYVAIILPVLICLVGLGADTAYVYMASSQLQDAADAAALAGAAEVQFSTSQAVTNAMAAAAANKAAQASVQLATSDVVVGNYNQTSNTFTANGTPYNAVQVTARRTTGSPSGPLNLIFGKMPLIGVGSVNVSRSATAMTAGTMNAAVVALSSSTSSAVSTTATLACGTGGVQCNSNSSSCVSCSGSGKITGTEVRCCGTTSGSGSSFPSTVYTGATPVTDPCASLPEPAKGSDLGSISHTTGSSTYSCSPGYYSGGITLAGSNSLNLTQGTYILGPPGLQVSGSASINAYGCTFFCTTGNSGSTCGTVSCAGSGSISLVSSFSGTYEGVCIFEDRNCPSTSSCSFACTSSPSCTGTIYCPSCACKITCTGSQTISNQIICNTLSVTGSGTTTVAYDGRNPVTINNVFLVK